MVPLILKINVFLILTLTSFLGYTLMLRVHLNYDANYYLMIAREILAGHTPTYDLNCSYPPLVMYIYAAFMRFFSSDYIYIKLFMLLMHHLNCLLLYLILNSKIKNKLLTIIVCCVYFLFTLSFDGLFIVLEPFQIFFILIAVLLFIKYKNHFRCYIFTGISLGMALMCKQYSVIFIASFCINFIYINFIEKKSFSSLLIKLICFSFCTVTPYLLFILFSKAQIFQSLEAFGLIGNVATSYARDIPISIRMKSFCTLANNYPVIFAPFLVYPFFRIKNNQNTSLYDLVFLVGLFSMMPLFVRQYKHYIQLVLPWSFILWSLFISELFKLKVFSIFSKKIVVHSLLLLIIAIFTIPMLPSSEIAQKKILSYFPNKPKRRIKQLNEAKLVAHIFPPQSKVYIIGGGCLYYDSQLFNPLRDYSFSHYKKLLNPNEDFPFDNVQNFLISCLRNQKTRKKIKRILSKKGYRQIPSPSGLRKSKFEFYTNN